MNPLDQTLRDFLDEFLVHCPKCSGAAHVAWRRFEKLRYSASLVCTACGHSKYGEFGHQYNPSRRPLIYGGPIDPYFHLPLRLQAECCGQVLWAYNYRHLAYLSVFVEAKHRDGGPSGRRNLSAKLPKWIGLAKNRRRILKAIEKLARQ